MSETEHMHTAGPWTTGDSDPATILGAATRFRDGGVGHHLCAIATVCASNDPGEDRANARLIAAAPELLEACRRASYQLATDDGDRRALLAQLDAAITKAEGRA